MIVFRILQAIPGGILPVVTLSMRLPDRAPGEDRRRDGHVRPGHHLRPAIGPTLGGYLVEYVDWRLIFFINVPVGILGAVAAVMLLPKFAAP